MPAPQVREYPVACPPVPGGAWLPAGGPGEGEQEKTHLAGASQPSLRQGDTNIIRDHNLYLWLRLEGLRLQFNKYESDLMIS